MTDSLEVWADNQWKALGGTSYKDWIALTASTSSDPTKVVVTKLVDNTYGGTTHTFRLTTKLDNTDLYRHTDISIRVIADCTLASAYTTVNANLMAGQAFK